MATNMTKGEAMTAISVHASDHGYTITDLNFVEIDSDYAVRAEVEFTVGDSHKKYAFTIGIDEHFHNILGDVFAMACAEPDGDAPVESAAEMEARIRAEVQAEHEANG